MLLRCGSARMEPPGGGAAHPSGVGGSPAALAADSGAAPALALHEPALLCRVFGHLGVRDRVRCTAVCRAWHAALQPPAAPTPDDVSAWARLDMSPVGCPVADARRLGHRPTAAQVLRIYILPSHGSHIRELCLRDAELVDDELLFTVVEHCPQLRLLDARGCQLALRSYVLVGGDDEAHACALRELLETLYERAAPGEHFTLLLEGSGIDRCGDCGYFCEDAAALVVEALAAVLAWPIKLPPALQGTGTDAAQAAPRPCWLRCDVALCALHDVDYEDDGFECGTLIAVPQDGCCGAGAGEEALYWPASAVCDGCGREVCAGCSSEHTCEEGGTSVFCAACCDTFEEERCALCEDITCQGCIAQRCVRFGRAAGGCNVLACDDCLSMHPNFFTRCGGCAAAACPAHTAICARCTARDALPPGRGVPRPHRFLLGNGDFRAVAQCCRCQRTHCAACDPGPGGQAGDAWADGERAGGAGREQPWPSSRPSCAPGADCVFCCSWPALCDGRQVALRRASGEAGTHFEVAAAEAAAAAVEAAAAAQAAPDAPSAAAAR